MNDYYKGTISGIAQTISGHPFDTIKVLKQNNIQSKISLKNLLNYYKGITFPLISNSVVIGSQFYIYHNHSSLLAGLVSGLIITPIDYFKTQKQILKNYKYRLQRPLGFGVTISRELVSVPIYFNSYYYINHKIDNSFISGGIAGILSWLVPYPLDTIKTRVQSGYSLKESIKLGNLFKGLKFCILRAFLVNSIGFYCAENI
jgi:hypothetical protein